MKPIVVVTTALHAFAFEHVLPAYATRIAENACG